MQIIKIVQHFRFEGEYLEASQLTFGHINDTFIVGLRGGGWPKKALYPPADKSQRIQGPPRPMMDNIAKVTRHLQRRIVETGGDPARETLNIILR